MSLLKIYGKGKRRKREKKTKVVVTSDGTLFCRLQWEEEGHEREEGEASKWDKLINHDVLFMLQMF